MVEAREEKPQIANKEETPEVGESLLLKKVLLKAKKEIENQLRERVYIELHESPKENVVK